jgi:hypothetical protein
MSQGYLFDAMFIGIYVVVFAQATYLQVCKARKGQYYNKFIFWTSIYIFFSAMSVSEIIMISF